MHSGKKIAKLLQAIQQTTEVNSEARTLTPLGGFAGSYTDTDTDVNMHLPLKLYMSLYQWTISTLKLLFFRYLPPVDIISENIDDRLLTLDEHKPNKLNL